jgi:hypothetical protein
MDSFVQKAVWAASTDPYENALGECLLSRSQVQIFQKLMRTVDAAFTAAGVEYFAIAGTLLGTLRHAGHIPWDPDVDVGVSIDGLDKMMDCEEARDILERGRVAVHPSRSKNMRATSGDNSSCFCDIFLMNIIDGRVRLIEPWSYMAPYENADIKDIYPTKRMLWCGLPIRVPAQAEQLTKAMYGPAWRTAKISHAQHYKIVPQAERDVNANPTRFATYADTLVKLRVSDYVYDDWNAAPEEPVVTIEEYSKTAAAEVCEHLLRGDEILRSQNVVDFLMRIAEKHGLQPFAIGGTAAGARHLGGQIPWHGLIEFGVTQEDFESLLALKVVAEDFTISPDGSGRLLVFGKQLDCVVYAYSGKRGETLHSSTAAADGITARYSTLAWDDVFPVRRMTWCGGELQVLAMANDTVPAADSIFAYWKGPELDEDSKTALQRVRVPLLAVRAYWPTVYAAQAVATAAHASPSPSPFAQWLHETERVVSGMRIVDVGCGNMRDAKFFRSAGCHVIGLDPFASEAMADLIGVHLVRCSPLELSDAQRQTCFGTADVVYMRFLAHAVPFAVFTEIVSGIASKVRYGCAIAIEARSRSGGHAVEFTENEHFRSPVLVQDVLRLLERDWEITYLENRRGLAPCPEHPKAHSRDPMVLRVVAKRLPAP